jgi:hypothetical protein
MGVVTLSVYSSRWSAMIRDVPTKMPNKHERFVAAYLSLNGYFHIPNFIVHAGDDPDRISKGVVGNYTECDTLAIRPPHSIEVIGAMRELNHMALTQGLDGRIDVVIVEAKSGKANKPNGAWLTGKADPVISYIVRVIGDDNC